MFLIVGFYPPFFQMILSLLLHLTMIEYLKCGLSKKNDRVQKIQFSETNQLFYYFVLFLGQHYFRQKQKFYWSEGVTIMSLMPFSSTCTSQQMAVVTKAGSISNYNIAQKIVIEVEKFIIKKINLSHFYNAYNTAVIKLQNAARQVSDFNIEKRYLLAP